MSRNEVEARFGPGQIVRHLRFDYRGVIVDVDPVFSGTDEWYDQVARSRPPKDEPWYHVLVDGAEHATYVCLLYTSPSPRDGLLSRMPSSA